MDIFMDFSSLKQQLWKQLDALLCQIFEVSKKCFIVKKHLFVHFLLFNFLYTLEKVSEENLGEFLHFHNDLLCFYDFSNFLNS